jgi:hypothetical protein
MFPLDKQTEKNNEKTRAALHDLVLLFFIGMINFSVKEIIEI